MKDAQTTICLLEAVNKTFNLTITICASLKKTYTGYKLKPHL